MDGVFVSMSVENRPGKIGNTDAVDVVLHGVSLVEDVYVFVDMSACVLVDGNGDPFRIPFLVEQFFCVARDDQVGSVLLEIVVQKRLIRRCERLGTTEVELYPQPFKVRVRRFDELVAMEFLFTHGTDHVDLRDPQFLEHFDEMEIPNVNTGR